MAIMESQALPNQPRRQAFKMRISSQRRASGISSPNPDAFNPDIFKLQVDELLADIQPSIDAHLQKANSSLQRIKDAIQALPSRSPLTATKAEQLLNQQSKVHIPFPEPRPSVDTKYTMEYAPPAAFSMPETAAIGTLLSRDQAPLIDVVLTMPSHMFQGKDYLNHRYFHKRAFYIACIAAGLIEVFAGSVILSFVYHNGNVLQPSLVMSQPEGYSREKVDLSGFCFRFLATGSGEVLPLSKTVPWRNCIRAHKDVNSEQTLQPTAFYNSTLRSEASVQSYSDLFDHLSGSVPSFHGATLLTALWLRQRGYGSDCSLGGFGVFESSTIMALLLQKGAPDNRPLFSSGYSHSQLFKAFLSFIAARNLIQSPFILGVDQERSMKQIFQATPVFFDGTRAFNVLYNMNIWSYEKLRHEASLTLACLNDNSVDRFHICFIARVDNALLQSDYTLRATIPTLLDAAVPESTSNEHAFGACRSIYSILKTALNDRIQLIWFKLPSPKNWSVRAPNLKREPAAIELHLITNTENADRTIDHGPSAEDRESAKAFRSFWGEKTELRRFRDGSIKESLIWSASEAKEPICCQIIRYALGRHVGSDLADSVVLLRDDFQHRLPEHNPAQARGFFTNMWQSFELLQQHINNLEGLPLQIRQISPASAELRFSSLSLGNMENKRFQPADVVLQFESSGRWPDDPAAIERTKVAMLLKLGELLERRESSLRTKVGLQNRIHNLVNVTFLDITIDKYSFRVWIHDDKERTLLERQLKSPESIPSTKEAVARAISAHKNVYANAPLHTQVVRNLCIQYPYLSPTIRLLKKWCSCHLLLPHLNEEFVELLAISVFTQPYPYSPPGSLRTGFLRSISRLAKWNWATEPLLVNLIEKLSNAETEAIQTNFTAWRKIDPAMKQTVLVVGTPLDIGGIAWTQRRPQRVIATRLTALAKASLASAMSDGAPLEEKPLFRTPTGDYDFIIYINQHQKSKGHPNSGESRIVTPNRHPSDVFDAHDRVNAYVEELERTFRDNIVFMHDGHEKAIVAGLWNPAAAPRAWKVNLPFSAMPYYAISAQGERSQRITINKAAILHEIARLGGNIVSNIQVQSSLAP